MGKRTDRAFDIMRENNRRYLEKRKRENDSAKEPDTEEQEEKDLTGGADTPLNPLNPDNPDNPEKPENPETENPAENELTPEEKAAAFHEEEAKLEKGDVPAMILSAMLVFGPIFLILIAIVVFAWFFLQ